MHGESYIRAWFLNSLPIWYATHKLKQRKNTENWDDEQYYKKMYSIPLLNHENVGDKFAGIRDKISDEILKDKTASSIIDLATGRGYQARNIWRCGYKNVQASDIQVGRVAQAKQLSSGTGVTFRVADMKQRPCRDAIFDAITISGALHDLKAAEVEESLRECYRVLKESGKLIIMEPRYLGDIAYILMRKMYSFACIILDESVNMGDFIDFNIESYLKTLGFKLVKKQIVWYSILCLYTFQKLG